MMKKRIVKPVKDKKNGRQNRPNNRMLIINAAKKFFAEKGFQKTTVVEISKSIGLSEAALYEYFKGKEALLLEIPKLWVSDLLTDLEDQLFGITGAENKLRKYLWWYLKRIEQSPLDAKIAYLNLKMNSKFLETEVYSDVRKLYSYPISFISEGIKNGEMKSDLNPHVARDIFVSTIDHMITRWLLKDMSYSLFGNIDTVFNTVIHCFKRAYISDKKC